MDAADVNAYLQILNEELIPALGCTEPCAVAYACAKGRAALGALPEEIRLIVSGNIIKNVKSVTVPNSGGMKGLAAAAVLGALAGNPEKLLEVLSDVTPEGVAAAEAYLKTHRVRVTPAQNGEVFYIEALLLSGTHTVRLIMRKNHTNITLIERDGTPLLETAEDPGEGGGTGTDRSCLSVEGILAFLVIV